jgi:hypothetical protein
MTNNYKPRIAIEVRQDQLDELRSLLDWGIRSRVFEPIIDDLIVMLRKDRASVTALLLSREIRLNDFLQKGLVHGDS